MKILIVNTYDGGGAGKACLRLHEGLLHEGVDSFVLLKRKQIQHKKTKQFEPNRVSPTVIQKLKNKAKRILKELKLLKTKNVSPEVDFLQSRQTGLEFFSFPQSNLDITESPLYQEADIINLHWVANFLDYKSFFEKNTKPVVWTLHDMNPFSGGEHYTEQYYGIDEFGYSIPRVISEKEQMIFKQNILLKEQAVGHCKNLSIVSLCTWMSAEVANNSIFKGFPLHCIPNGINSEIYAIRDQEYSREILSIPKGKKVILFVADSISNNRKGFVFLKRAFEQLANPNLMLCAIGKKNSELESINNIYELGPINDERLMSIAYSAADVFVVPSIMDNLPNTVLESLMCGTPVIGFPVGGIPDMIQDNENGYIVEEISVDSLVKTLNKFLNNASCFNKIEIRKNTLKKYDQKVQAQRYIDLFDHILNSEI